MQINTQVEPLDVAQDNTPELKVSPSQEESSRTTSTASHSEGEEDSSQETTTTTGAASPSNISHKNVAVADEGGRKSAAALADTKMEESGDKKVAALADADTNGMEEGPRFMEAMAPMMTKPVVSLTLEERSALTNHQVATTTNKEPQTIPDKEREEPLATTEESMLHSPKRVDWADPRSTKAHLQNLIEQRTKPFQEEIRAIYRNQQAEKKRSAGDATMEGQQHQHHQPPRHQQRSLLLLSGPSGSGKRRLAESSLRNLVEQDGEGFYLEGHYDSLRRPIPYGGLVQAFSSFTKLVVERGLVEDMRQAIYSHLGTCADVSVLTSMIPALHGVLGCSELQNEDGSYRKNKKATKTNDDPIQRFIFAFRMFVRAITSGGRPLVLVLHDLHFADPCSLDILAGIATDPRNRGLFFFVGTCDDQQVTSSSYLAIKLRDMEDANCLRIHNISLQPLQLADGKELRNWLAKALQMDLNQGHERETSSRLARLLLTHTKGNWFLVAELIQWLQESDLLCFDVLNHRWVLSTPEEIDVVLNNGNSNDFLAGKLEQQLSQETQQVLKASACLGCTVDGDLLELLLDYPLNKTLEDLVKRGLLAHNAKGGEHSNMYAFVHDEIRQAAYRLIPEPELFHLEIGRRMWRKLSADALEEHLFMVLSQMYVGRSLITREKERVAITMLCLHAGKKAAKSSTFRMAATYLRMGLELLTCPIEDPKRDRCWHEEYELTLQLHLAAAEMTMCCGSFDETHELLEPVFKHTKTFEDSLQAYSTKMYALSQQDRPQECIDLGISVLRRLGETFPRRLCLAHMMQEMRSVGKLLKNKSNEQICRMQSITDAKKLAALQVLNFMILPCVAYRPKLAAFVFLKMTKITMQHGLSVFASGAFGTYGMLYISATCDAEKGARFGELALVLLEQFGIMTYLPRVHAAVFGCIHAWTKPMQSALEPLQHAYRIGMATGDAEYGGLCANLYCFYAFDSGVKLDVIRREYNSMKESLITAKQAFVLRMFLPLLQMIHHFMGLSADPLSTKGDIMDYDEYAEFVLERGSAMGVMCLKVDRMIMGYMFGDLRMSEENTLTCQEIMETPPTFERVLYLFYIGLIAVACAREGRNYRRNLQTVTRVQKWMKKVGRSSPHNGLDKSNLIQAELASLLGQKQKAYEKYVTAIALAQESGHLFIKALSNELLARHLLRVGDSQSKLQSKACFERSIETYEEWGGVAKVTRLQDEVRSLFGTCEEYNAQRRCTVSGMLPGSSRTIVDQGHDGDACVPCTQT